MRISQNQPMLREWPTFRATRALPPRTLVRSMSGPVPNAPVSPALSNLFAGLVASGAVRQGRDVSVWDWMRTHAHMWRAAAPDQHAVATDDTPMAGAVRAWAVRLNIDADDLLDALNDEVAGGVCLAETEAIARQALKSPGAHPLAWLRALDPVAITEAQMQAALRGAMRTAMRAALGGSDDDAMRPDVLAPLDALFVPAAHDPARAADLQAFLAWVTEQDTTPLTARTVATDLSGTAVAGSGDELWTALQAHGSGLFEVVFQLQDDDVVRRHAVLLCTVPSVNGPWLYDPNQAGFFCGGAKVAPQTFVHDFADYLTRLYGLDATWHWTAAF